MTKLAPEWVRTNDPVIRSPARYRWTTAPAHCILKIEKPYDLRMTLGSDLARWPLVICRWGLAMTHLNIAP